VAKLSLPVASAFLEPDGITPAKGSITFKLFAPGDTGCTGTPVATSVVAVSGDGMYKASTGTITGTLTPTTPGTYQWTASYSGDPPNTLGVTEGCGGTNEASLLIQLPTSISTAQSFDPHDSATITAPSGAGPLSGTVDFQLFVNTTSSCTTGLPAFDSGPITINGGPTGLSQTVSVDSNQLYNTTGTTFNWLVTYTSGNPGQKSVTSSCTNESSSLTINNGSTITSS
jgi:hypothetical protein